MKLLIRALFIIACCTTYGCVQTDAPLQPTATPSDCVILLHGLARSSDSMEEIEQKLKALDYIVVNQDYPSSEYPIATLAEKFIPPALEQCRAHNIRGIHFVAHSLGAILVRQYLSVHPIPELKRVVMLAPPNKGSEVVDHLKQLSFFVWLNGKAGAELGTEPTSVPNSLGPANFDVGVIAGTSSINLLLSLYLPNPDDGKVSVDNTKLEGMRDFITYPVSHPFIMKDNEVIAQIIYYLQHGQFVHPHP
ncbi:MAG TPA: alpha/beta fold hydrolase [Cellvibrio sp.]|nr:alpha/beta fold hydrolase [Cellvibrio sp.]